MDEGPTEWPSVAIVVMRERVLSLGAIEPPDSTQIDSGWNPGTAVNLSAVGHLICHVLSHNSEAGRDHSGTRDTCSMKCLAWAAERTL